MSKFLLQAACLVAFLPIPAVAQDRLPDVTVSYADLDLSRPEGLRILDRRLNRAVRAACPRDDSPLDLQRKREVETCRAAKAREVAGVREIALAKAMGNVQAVAMAH